MSRGKGRYLPVQSYVSLATELVHYSDTDVPHLNQVRSRDGVLWRERSHLPPIPQKALQDPSKTSALLPRAGAWHLRVSSPHRWDNFYSTSQCLHVRAMHQVTVLACSTLTGDSRKQENVRLILFLSSAWSQHLWRCLHPTQRKYLWFSKNIPGPVKKKMRQAENTLYLILSASPIKTRDRTTR